MIVGIVAAKAHSKRFPNKNIYLVEGSPMFWHSVEPLLAAAKVDKVYVATDSEFIRGYCEERGVDVVWRPKNAAFDEDSILSVLRFAYYHLDQDYDAVVTIMANCPGHSPEAVDRAVDMIQTGEFKEIRSFNDMGEESGLMVFETSVIMQYAQISSYIGSIRSNVKEIHRIEDLNDRDPGKH